MFHGGHVKYLLNDNRSIFYPTDEFKNFQDKLSIIARRGVIFRTICGGRGAIQQI